MRIGKEGSWFRYPEYIDREMKKLFAGLAKESYVRAHDADGFAVKAAHFLTELNAIHPFREGNGRAQLSFLILLAEQAGHPLNLDKLDPEAVLAATIRSFAGSEKPLLAVIRKLIK